jgi:hypothetical protein
MPQLIPFEVSEAMLATKDVIFIGRPETNSALVAWNERIGLDYEGAVFKANGNTSASECDSLVFAARNPLNAAHVIVVNAGNSPLETADRRLRRPRLHRSRRIYFLGDALTGDGLV